MAFQAINDAASASATPPVDSTGDSPADSAAKDTQPEIKTQNDDSSVAASADAAASQIEPDSALLDAGAYGTRSRNRTGNARPNYSEDQEYDYDFVSSAATTTANAVNKKPQAAAGASDAGNADSKRAANTASVSQTNGVAGTDPNVNSKKRKAAVAATQAVISNSSTTSVNGSGVAMRKTAAPTTTNTREISIMTFAKSKACLNKKGELIADDGTKLAVDGK